MKRFQLHLSTLLVLSILAGGFVWLNVRPTRDDVQRYGESRGDFPYNYDISNRGRTGYWKMRGFPFKFQEWYIWPDDAWFRSRAVAYSFSDERFDGWKFTLNCMIGLAALAAVGYCCEQISKRRKA
jgi:hypothetical protein